MSGMKDEFVEPQRGAKTVDQLPQATQLPEPRTVSHPDFDPFERVLQPLLDRDTARCNVWKDEVQNILIFAGLFSAVVTAFIIESYQLLQPDPNDAVIGLLAHIAEKLDNPSANGTTPVSSIISDTKFSPSPSDISINICWFISLVLSLTAALVGIIMLQWLREHQRYDDTSKPQQKMAVLNARLHSIDQWYVSEMFTGLPLLLQAALVLFLAGLVEFLFALRYEVAIPVTLVICVPLIFLIATTLLPVLQIYILQYPFRLSINDNVPSPCPYKSPQSLITRCLGIHNELVFKFFAPIVAGAYVCIVEIGSFVRRLTGSQPAIFRSQRHRLQVGGQDQYPQPIRAICAQPDAPWTSTDIAWLSNRAIHAVSLQQAKSCSDNGPLTTWTINNMALYPAEVYDCIGCLRRVIDQDPTRVDHHVLYWCVRDLLSDVVGRFQEQRRSSPPWGAHLVASETVDFCFALGQLFEHIYPPISSEPQFTAAFIKDLLLDDPQDGSEAIVGTLCAAIMASATQSIRASVGPTVRLIADEGSARLVMNRLRISPEKLFAISSGDMWLPEVLRHSADLQENPSPSVTHLYSFLERCSTMQSNSYSALRPGPAKETYGGIAAYMHVIVRYQPKDTYDDSLAHLTQLCDSCDASTSLIDARPFLMIAACFYLDAVLHACHHPVSVFGGGVSGVPWFALNYRPLLDTLSEACGIREGLIENTHSLVQIDLDKLINAIYNRHRLHGHDPFQQPTINPSGPENV